MVIHVPTSAAPPRAGLCLPLPLCSQTLPALPTLSVPFSLPGSHHTLQGLVGTRGLSRPTCQTPPSPIGPPLSPQVKVILGEDREATGILLSIDGEDGIVRMDLDEQLKILNLRFLGKLLEA